MRRPPDRKLITAAALLVAAAAVAAAARPALGTTHAVQASVLVKLFGRS